jgi:two-component system response regulator
MKTILQVDDDANDIFLLQHAMKKVGVTNPIQVATDGQEAIDYLRGIGKFTDREKFPFPGLLLMDLKLPYVMGLDVLRWIRTQPRTPLMVLVLTASAEDDDIAEAYRLGANAFLTKPSEASKLEDMVRAIKAFWLTHNTLPPEPLSQSSHQRVFSLVVSPGTLPIAESLLHTAGLSDRTCNGNGLLAGPPSHPRQPQGAKARSNPALPLTRRQTEVMQLIADGYSSREIARQLSLSIKTVEKHRQAIMDKLDIHEIATLTRYAVFTGVVESNFAPLGTSAARWHPCETTRGLDADAGNRS